MSLPPILQHLRIPVIAAPMFIVSNPELVIAQCKAGIVGSFPALNARPAAALGEWLDRITSELGEHNAKHPDRPAAPFAVNRSARAKTSTRRRKPMAASRCTTSSTIISPARRWKKGPPG